MITVNGPFIFALIIIIFIVAIKWIEWYLFRNGAIRIEKKIKEIDSERKESRGKLFLRKLKEILFFDKGDLKKPWYLGVPLFLFIITQNIISYLHAMKFSVAMCFLMLGYVLVCGCDLFFMLNANKKYFLDKNLKKRFIKTQMAQIILFFVLVGGLIVGMHFHDAKIEMDPPALKESVDWVIEPIYEAEWPQFSEGLAPVKKDGKWGYIDSTGKEIIPFQYDDAIGFGDGLAPVQLNGKWMVIDREGNIVFKTNFDIIGEYHEGAAKVEMQDDQYGSQIQTNMIDKQGTLLFKGDYSFDGNFSEGCLLVWDKEFGRYYFIDKNEEKVIQLNFFEGGDFFAGYAPVGLDNGAYALIDHEGKIVKCLSADEYFIYHGQSEGLSISLEGEWSDSLFKKNTLRYGLVDLYGNIIVPAKFRAATSSSDGLIGLQVNGLWGFIKNPIPEAAWGINLELWKEDRTQIALVEGLPVYAGELEQYAYRIKESDTKLIGIPAYQKAFEQLKKEKAFEMNGMEISTDKIQYQIGSTYYKKILLENQ